MKARILIIVTALILVLSLMLAFAAPVSATIAQVVPGGVVAYLPIPLSNGLSSPVPGGAQVSINAVWKGAHYDYSSYLDNPVDNYVFFNSAGTILNSWLEKGTDNTGSTLFWVQLDSNGIAAKPGTVTINLGFYPKGQLALSATGSTGVAPQLCSVYGGTYGQYDNGARVFNQYWNFAGTGVPGGWTALSTGTTVNNGFTVAPGQFLETGSPYPLNDVTDAYESAIVFGTAGDNAGMSLVTDQNGGQYNDTAQYVAVGLLPGTFTMV